MQLVIFLFWKTLFSALLLPHCQAASSYTITGTGSTESLQGSSPSLERDIPKSALRPNPLGHSSLCFMESPSQTNFVLRALKVVPGDLRHNCNWSWSCWHWSNLFIAGASMSAGLPPHIRKWHPLLTKKQSISQQMFAFWCLYVCHNNPQDGRNCLYLNTSNHPASVHFGSNHLSCHTCL